MLRDVDVDNCTIQLFVKCILKTATLVTTHKCQKGTDREDSETLVEENYDFLKNIIFPSIQTFQLSPRVLSDSEVNISV